MEQGLSVTFGSASDRGLKREDNQDSCGKFPQDDSSLQTPKGQLFVVADGMGGHAGGRHASQIAVQAIGELYFADGQHDIGQSLQHAVAAANQRIYEASTTSYEFYGMGTTCTVLVLQGEAAYIAHVGDSRAYRVTSNRIEQLTHDHSKVAEMQRLGIITEEEAKRHPEKSQLYRALGIYADLQVDLITGLTIQHGDHFLLCTDGLAKVEAQELKKIVLAHSPVKACKKLIKLANARGGEDNATVQIVRVRKSNASKRNLFSWFTRIRR